MSVTNGVLYEAADEFAMRHELQNGILPETVTA